MELSPHTRQGSSRLADLFSMSQAGLCLNFKEEEMESQRRSVTCLRSTNEAMALDSRVLGLRF